MEMSEVYTRIDVAHDQALTAACQIPNGDERWSTEDRNSLSAAIDLLKDILDRREAKIYSEFLAIPQDDNEA